MDQGDCAALLQYLETVCVRSLTQKCHRWCMVHPSENVTVGTMPDTKMSIALRFKYYGIQYERYRKASDAGKSEVLDEMMAAMGLRKKSLLRRMRTKPIRKERQKQRGKQYSAAVQDAIRLIA